jgi:subtilisin
MFDIIDFEVSNVITNRKEVIDWGCRAVNAPSVWKVARGKGIRVAVLDSGIQESHPDLKVFKSRDFTKSNNWSEDSIGHGTHVAGIIAGVDNTEGVVGIAPLSVLYNGKVISGATGGSLQSLIDGIQWCINEKVNVINMSLGTKVKPSAVLEGEVVDPLHEIIKLAYSKGIVLVAASGNDNKGSLDWPAAYPEVIAVNASDINKRRASFSNYAENSEFVAPGVQIYSTYLNNQYAKMSGTSMATPILSGCICLMLEYAKRRRVNLNQTEIYNILIESARDLGASGFDRFFGHGMVDCDLMIKNVEKRRVK